MSKQQVEPMPKDVETFLRRTVELYLRGHRDESFAEWAATCATLLLERSGLLY
jgi:hypothetical protein